MFESHEPRNIFIETRSGSMEICLRGDVYVLFDDDSNDTLEDFPGMWMSGPVFDSNS